MDTCNFKDDPNCCFFRYIFSYPSWRYFLAHPDEEISGVSVFNDIAKEIFKKYQEYVKCDMDEKIDYKIKFTHEKVIYFLCSVLSVEYKFIASVN